MYRTDLHSDCLLKARSQICDTVIFYFCSWFISVYELNQDQYGSSSETHCQSSTHVCLLTHGQTFWIFLVLMKKSCSVQNGFFTLCTDGKGEVTNHVILLTLASVNNNYYMHWTSLLLFFKASTSHQYQTPINKALTTSALETEQASLALQFYQVNFLGSFLAKSGWPFTHNWFCEVLRLVLSTGISHTLERTKRAKTHFHSFVLLPET